MRLYFNLYNENKSSINLCVIHLHHQAVKGGCELIIAGRQAVNKWYEIFQVSEVSQSLRDAADAIREMCRTQRKQFDVIRYVCGVMMSVNVTFHR